MTKPRRFFFRNFVPKLIIEDRFSKDPAEASQIKDKSDVVSRFLDTDAGDYYDWIKANAVGRWSITVIDAFSTYSPPGQGHIEMVFRVRFWKLNDAMLFKLAFQDELLPPMRPERQERPISPNPVMVPLSRSADGLNRDHIKIGLKDHGITYRRRGGAFHFKDAETAEFVRRRITKFY